MMSEAFQEPMGTLVREQVVLFVGHQLGAGTSVRSVDLKAKVLNISIKAVVSRPAMLSVEEFDGKDWTVSDTTELYEGEMVWHHQLKRPEFRIAVDNRSGEDLELSLAVSMVSAPSDN